MADDQGVEVQLHAYLKNLATKSQNGDDCSFMEIIKEFPSICNRSSAQFKDKNIKSNAWKEIASLHTDMDVNTCKQRYESIRTTFSRYLKRCKPPSGSGSDSVILEAKYEHLRWLCPFIKSRSTCSNIIIPEEPLKVSGTSMDTSREEEDEEETVCVSEYKPSLEILERCDVM